MDVEAIRSLRRADPFTPFRLILQDGRQLPVERRSFVGVSPNGKYLVHASVEGGLEFLKIPDVVDAVPDPNLKIAGSPH